MDRKTDRLINPGVSSSQRVSAGTEEGSQEAFWKKIAIAIEIVFVFVVIISGFTYPDAAVSVYRALFLAGAVLAYLFAYRTKSTLLAVLGGIAIGFLGTMFDLIFISMYVGENQILSSDLLMVLWVFGTFAAAVFMGVKITNNAMYYTEINRKK